MVVVDVRNIDMGITNVHVEDGNFRGMVNVDEMLVGWNDDSTTKKLFDMCSTYKTGIDGTSDAINWSLETKPLYDPNYNTNTHVTDIWVMHEGSSDKTMTCDYWDNKNTTDGSTTYTSIALSTDFTLSTPGIKRNRLLPTTAQLQNSDIYKFKFSGTGYRKFHGLQVNQITFGEMV